MTTKPIRINGGFLRDLVTDELSYNLSRKYPFGNRFKLGVFIVSVIVFGSLSIFSLAANGFDKDFKYTADPNATAAITHWYTHNIFTWGSDSLKPKCQNTEIPVGKEFITTNLGFRYTVRRILYFPPGSKDGQQRATVSYHNNTLENCEINVITIYLRKADMSKPNSESSDFVWWSWMDSSADAVARCDFWNEDGFFTLEFLVKYSAIVEDYSYLAVDNATTHASFWWGSRLLNAYFVGTQYVMSGPLPDSNPDTEIYTQATLSFRLTNNTSMKDPLLFTNWFYFLTSTGRIANAALDQAPDPTTLYNNATLNQSRPLTEGFMWAKIFRSLILADLGNSNASNLLLSTDLLQYALDPGAENFNRVSNAPLDPQSRKRDWYKFGAIPFPGRQLNETTAVPLNKAYTTLKDMTGPLGTRTARIYAQYICTVPEPKSRFAMVISTLVATLAFFQTAWMLFKYVADRLASWKDPIHSNWCEGCLRSQYEMRQLQDDGGSMGPLLQDESLVDMVSV